MKKYMKALLLLSLACSLLFGSLAAQEEGEEKPVEEDPERIAERERVDALNAGGDVLAGEIDKIAQDVKRRLNLLKEERSSPAPSEEKIAELTQALGEAKSRLDEILKEKKALFEELNSFLRLVNSSNGLPNCRLVKEWNGMWKSNPSLGDVNNDGYLDMAAVCRLNLRGTRGLRVWLYDGKGGWIESCKGLPPGMKAGGSTKFADVNKDGNLDLIAGLHGGGIYVFLGDGKGNWKESSEGIRKRDTWAVNVADFNGDGNLDIIESTYHARTGVKIYLGDGAGKWKEWETNLPKRTGGHDIAAADFNGDGHMDFAFTATGPPYNLDYEWDPVWLGDGKGRFKSGSIGIDIPCNGAAWGVDAGDVNNDGNIDLVFGFAGAVTTTQCSGPLVYLGNGLGMWREACQGLSLSSCRGVKFVDLDMDGNLDLVYMNGAGALAFHRGDGRGNWQVEEAAGYKPLTLRGWGIAVGDIDGNGLPDIVCPQGNEGAFRIGPAPPADPRKPQAGGSVQAWMNRRRGFELQNKIAELKKEIDKALAPE